MLCNTPPFEAWIFHPCGWVHCGTNTEREWKLHQKESALTCPSKVLASLLWSSRYHQSNAFNTPFRKESLFNQFNLYYRILQDLLIYGLLALTAHRTRYGAAWSCYDSYERLLCDALHVTIVPWSSTLWAEGGHGLRRARGWMDMIYIVYICLHNDLIWYEYSCVIYMYIMYIWVMWVIFKQIVSGFGPASSSARDAHALGLEATAWAKPPNTESAHIASVNIINSKSMGAPKPTPPHANDTLVSQSVCIYLPSRGWRNSAG